MVVDAEREHQLRRGHERRRVLQARLAVDAHDAKRQRVQFVNGALGVQARQDLWIIWSRIASALRLRFGRIGLH